MTPVRRDGLLDKAAIREVIELEQTREVYREMRDALFKVEPTLAQNLDHWMREESRRLEERLPEMNKDQLLAWFRHCLERYLLRGWNLVKKAQGIDMSHWFEGDCPDAPDHERL